MGATDRACMVAEASQSAGPKWSGIDLDIPESAVRSDNRHGGLLLTSMIRLQHIVGGIYEDWRFDERRPDPPVNAVKDAACL